MTKTFAIIIFASLIFFSACEKDSGPLIYDSALQDTISFARDIQPIFNANCILCHNQYHPFLNLKDCCSWNELLFTGASAPYVDTLSPKESYLYIRVAGTGQAPPAMPPGGPYLSSDLTAKILRWIEQGARNN
mgnify:CR=1 FL=1